MAHTPMESRVWHLTLNGWTVGIRQQPQERFLTVGIGQQPQERFLTVEGTKYEIDGINEGYRYWESQIVWESTDKDQIAELYKQFGDSPDMETGYYV